MAKKNKKKNRFAKNIKVKQIPPQQTSTEVEESNMKNIEQGIKDEIEIKDHLKIRGVELCPSNFFNVLNLLLFRIVEEYTKKEQTYPPTKTITELFPKKNYPQGEMFIYRFITLFIVEEMLRKFREMKAWRPR